MKEFWIRRFIAQRWWIFIVVATSILTVLVFWRLQETASQYIFQEETRTNAALATISQTGSRYRDKQGKTLPQYRTEMALLGRLQSSLDNVYTALNDTTGQQYMTASVQSNQAAEQYVARTGDWLLTESVQSIDQRARYYRMLVRQHQVLAPPNLTTGFPNGLLPILHDLLTGWLGAIAILVSGLAFLLERRAKDRALVRLTFSRSSDLLVIERREYVIYVTLEIVTVLLVTVSLTLFKGATVFSDSTLAWHYLVDQTGATVFSAAGWPILLFTLAALAQIRVAQTGTLLFRASFGQLASASIIPLFYGWQTQSLAVVITGFAALPVLTVSILAWVIGYIATAVWLRKRG